MADNEDNDLGRRYSAVELAEAVVALQHAEAEYAEATAEYRAARARVDRAQELVTEAGDTVHRMAVHLDAASILLGDE